MAAFKHWKIVFSLVSIFVAGAITGGVVTFQVVRGVIRARTNPDQWSGRVFRDYRHRLDLTDEQQARLRPMMMEAGREMKRTRAEFMQSHGQLMRNIHTSLMRELTPEQRAVFEEIREEQMRRFRERGFPGERPFPGPDGRGKFGDKERQQWKKEPRARESRGQPEQSEPAAQPSLRQPPPQRD